MSQRPPEIKIHTHPLSLMQDPDRLRAVQRGDLIHLALFFLDYCFGREDIEQAILRAFALSGFDRARWNIENDYSIPLEAALSLPEVRPWFTREVESLREVEVIDAHGELHRIDRLIMGNEVLKVIDFKVGNREEGHRPQVELYKKLVEAVFHQSTKGYLLYIDEPAVVAVP